MSKYQPKIFINNPEKNVPDNIVEQFFMAIKTGDIDKIRDFAIRYKNKYNIMEKASKGNLLESGKTPLHVVLELDDKIADNNDKLRIINFLDQMGAPMDLPDSADVWPIHLAASLQSEEIIDFLINKKVSINRKDSSNNTPLQYAIYGKEISCPIPISIKPLAPLQKIDKLPLNKSLENANIKLINLISKTDTLNNNLIHMINTIMRIPDMYADDKLSRNLQTDVVTIFSEVALTPTFPSEETGVPKTGGLTVQQNKLEQLIEKTYSTVNNELLRGLTNPLDIAPNNGGWGPTVPTPGGPRPPNNLERIIKDDRANMSEIRDEYANLKNSITNISTVTTDTMLKINIPKLITTTDTNFIDKLIFCQDCDKIDYGEEVGLTKMLFLLFWNYNKLNYPNIFANKVMDNYKLIDEGFHGQIMMNTEVPLIDPYGRSHISITIDGIDIKLKRRIHQFRWATDKPGYLFKGSLPFIVRDNAFSQVRNNLDDFFANISNTYRIRTGTLRDIYGDSLGQFNCIRNALHSGFTQSSDTFFSRPDLYPVDLLTGNLGTMSLEALFNVPGFGDYRAEIATLNPDFRDSTMSWFEMLNIFIQRLEPATRHDLYNIFYDMYSSSFGLPLTPLPYSSGGGTVYEPLYDKYTYHELFRIMHALLQFLEYEDYRIQEYPDIFDYPINNWNNYIDSIGNKHVIFDLPKSIAELYPEFIFLYKILVTHAQQYIREAIVNCITVLINRIIDTSPTGDVNLKAFRNKPDVVQARELLRPFDDAYMYSMLLPSYPQADQFIADPDPFADLKANKWDRTNPLVMQFEDVIGKLDVNLLQDIGNIYFKNALYPPVPTPPGPAPQDPTEFMYGNMNDLRQLIENSTHNFNNNIRDVLNSTNFRTLIRQYFGTYIQPKVKKPPSRLVPNQDVLPRYNNITRTIELMDSSYDELFKKLRNQGEVKITDLFFLTEVYGHLFVKIKQFLLNMITEFMELNTIITDIITFINNSGFYYIPQIFLPALIKQIIVVVDYLIEIRDQLMSFNALKAEFYPFINISIKEHINILTLGDEFSTYVNNELRIIYTNMLEIVKYHNSVIDFLNYHSAFRLIRSSTDNTGRSTATLLFTMNLIPLETFPDIFTTTSNFNILSDVLRLYRIPEIIYHGDGNEEGRINFEIFGAKPVPPLPSNVYKFDTYRDIIEYKRSGIMSNSPTAGKNTQLNITVTVTPPNPNLIYSINDIPVAISGEWLKLNIDTPERTSYFNAFIAYIGNNYSYKWLDGMPASIRKLAGKHLRMLKQRIIEETIQHIINNNALPDTSAQKNQDLVNLYNEIKNLGNETTFTELDDVKINVVIGKILDSLLNKFLEYAIRQSISTWIYELTTTDYSFSKLTDEISKIIAIIRQKDYLKLSLNDVNVDSVKALLKINTKYIDFKLTQIEPDPRNIGHTTKPVANDLIHYLYDINYFSSSDINANKRCYQINTDIVSKFITGDIINSKNSDGNTALHMAININHPELVELLISRGANPRTFANIHGKTPYDLALLNMEKHINFANGQKVIDTINNFVLPFNDLLLARLKDEKFNNNIIKDISMGIPIQLIMYNHMFHLYMENYRYNMTIDLKNTIWSLLKKYYKFIDEYIYPFDLLKISDQQELIKITQSEIVSNRVSSAINTSNQKKIFLNEKIIKQIDIRLDSFKKEKDQTTDPGQKKNIDDIIDRLVNERGKIDAEITSLKIEGEPVVDTTIASAYTSAVNSIVYKIDRNLSLVEFYNLAFGRVGRTKKLYLLVWENYFNKKLNDAESMIFPLLNGIINTLITESKDGIIDVETKGELITILNFYTIARDYIESKTSYPDNLEENPIHREEFSQIIYLINLIVTPSIRNILLNQIYLGLREMDGANIIIEDQTAILDEILAINFNGQTIESYLYDILPSLATKYFTAIYYNDNDSDKKITNSGDLFLPLIQIVKANTIIQVTDNSLLVQNMKEYLIPFMENVYHNFIHHLRLAIYGYERYILNTYQLCKIMQLLI